jgi:hypothetical protein
VGAQVLTLLALLVQKVQKVQKLTQKALVGKSGSWHVRLMRSVSGWMLV